MGSLMKSHAKLKKYCANEEEENSSSATALLTQIQFVSDVIHELQVRGTQTLFRVLRRCAFRRRIRARIRARVALRYSLVFCDLPASLMRELGDKWL